MKQIIAICILAQMLAASCAYDLETTVESVEVDRTTQATFVSACGEKLAFDEATTKRLYDVAAPNIGQPWEGRLWEELSNEERAQWSATLDLFLGNNACAP